MSGIPLGVGGHTSSGSRRATTTGRDSERMPVRPSVGTRPRIVKAGYVVGMRVTHLGHACLLVELADTRILIDPGTFSTGFESLRDLDAVVVTHQHADHLDEERLPDLLSHNRQAPVYADPQSAELLSATSSDVVVLGHGEDRRVGRTTIHPVGRLHAVNHDAVPRCTNVGVVLRADGEPSLYHPGDAYDGEAGEVDVLAVPLNAPWCKVAETIGFVRRIAPQQIVPIHDALLSPVGRRLYLGHVEGYGGDDLTVHDLTAGAAADIALD
jgi:L-ascorbate metabolism protein UlaG (beta-lactamase superfamily)